MKTLYFEDIEDLCFAANDMYDGHNEVMFICKYKDAKEILRELVFYNHKFKEILLGDPEWTGYEDEYYVTINDAGIWCEKAKPKDVYLYTGGDIVFISGDSNTKVLKRFKEDAIVYEYSFDEGEISEEYDDFCECCYDRKEGKCFLDDEIEEGETYVHTLKDGDDVHGFSLSKYEDGAYKSYSYYGSDVLDEDRVRDILKKIDF